MTPAETEAYARAGTLSAVVLLAALAYVARTVLAQPSPRPPVRPAQAAAILALFTLLAFGPLAAVILTRPQAPASAVIGPDPAATPQRHYDRRVRP